MSELFFSVIIPALNEEKALPLLLEDLAQQTFRNFEVIVSDAQSSDNTAQVAQKFAKRFQAFRIVESTERNVSVQRNLGAAKAKAEFLFFFDADTRIPPYYLEGIHYAFTKTPFDAWVTAMEPDIKSPETEFVTRVQNFATEGGLQLGIPYAVGAAMGVRRAVFQAVKGFDPQMKFMEDTELIRRVVKAGYHFEMLKDPSYIFSTRRYRKEGTLQVAAKIFPTFLMSLVHLDQKTGNIPDLYPMNGGTYYDTKKPSATALRFKEIERIIRQMTKSKKKQIQQLLKEFAAYFSA